MQILLCTSHQEWTVQLLLVLTVSCLSASSTNSSVECCVVCTISLNVLSPFFLLPVRGSRHPAVLSPPPFCLSQCVSPLLSLSSLSSIRLLPLSSVLVSFYLYTGLQTFPPMATLAMRAYPWLTGSPHPPLWVPLYLWHHRTLCHFFSLLLVLTLALITSSKRTNVIHFYFNSLKPLKSAKHIRKNICPFWQQKLSTLGKEMN